jgi:hypothetical protein
MDREICYPIKILTKQFNNRLISSISTQTNTNFNPSFITGF